jgi:hypothetical protein
MSLIGFRSMIDSDCAQPTDERSTRNRPDTTDTLAPVSFHLAMAWRTTSGRRDDMLGVQLFGHRSAEVAKRIDIAATAIFNGMTVEAMSELDLSYTPPLGNPWDAVQAGAQAWASEP